MDITDVRIRLVSDPSHKLLAFASIIFDGNFVVRDLKIISGAKGTFVAMPSRKLCDHCPRCGGKNHLRAAHCSGCGQRLEADRARPGPDGRTKLHADIAHPINSACREWIKSTVLKAFEGERERSRQSGYRLHNLADEESFDDFDLDYEEAAEA